MMKRVCFLAALAAFLIAGAPGVRAEQGFGVYMGLGGSFALQKLDVDQYNGYYVDKYRLFPEFDDTAGLYAVAGMRIPIPDRARVAKMFSLEFRTDYLPNFDWDGVPNKSGLRRTTLNMDVDILTFTGAVRFDPKIGDIEVFRPYLVAGGGLMIGKIETTENRKGVAYVGSNTEHDPCVRVGLGFDYYLTETVSANMECDYVTGWHDLDELRYINTSLGLTFHM